MTRASELLILSGGTDRDSWPAPRPAARRSTGSARAARRRPPPSRETVVERAWDGRQARVRQRARDARHVAARAPRSARPAARAPARPAPRCPRRPRSCPPPPPRARPAPQRLSYSQLSDYARCGYRFYLRRVLGLPRRRPTSTSTVEPEAYAGIDPRMRGSIVHRAARGPRLRATLAARRRDGRELAADVELELTDGRGRGHPRFVAAFAALTAARAARRTRAASRREAWFAFALEPGGSGPLVARHRRRARARARRRALVVDYKTDRARGRRRPPTSSPATTRPSGSSTRSPRCAPARRASRSPTACSSAPTSRSPRRSRAADAPELAERARRSSPRACSTHDYPVTDTPHRELCGDCPGRAALCSHPQSVTLRPPPAPWPGAPARRSSPAGTSPAAGPPPR